MSPPTHTSIQAGRRSGRLLVSLGATLSLIATSTLVATSVLTPLPARADPAVGPKGGSFSVVGAGFGHGFGMSQYGAYGAARRGLSWQRILAFYYPGTQLARQSASATIRVWITGDYDNDLRVLPAAGLRVTDASRGSYALPVGAGYTAWRITRFGAGYRLYYRSAAGQWVRRSTPLATSTWTFSDTASLVRVWMPGGSYREFRGTAALVKRGTGGRTVNRLPMEDYVKSVVPAEMPTSWLAAAVRSQAVAARSYAARLQAGSGASGYDLCDTTSCQVYQGYAVTYGGRRTILETSNGNAAVRATARVVVTYRGAVALTQFASSNGGATANGGLPYLRAKADPYDGVITSSAWSRSLSSGSIAGAWPSVGTVRQLQVTSRDGSGRYGGRVRLLRIIGSRTTVTVTGTSFQYRFGLRSNLFTVRGAVPLPPPPVPRIPPGRAYAAFPRSYSSASRADLVLLTPAGNALRYPVVRGQLGRPVLIGRGLAGYTHVLNAGDWNGDGYQDVIGRTRAGRLMLFRGTSTGRLSSGIDMGITANFRTLTSVGDVNGDRFPDLVAITPGGNLWVLLGDGRKGRKANRKVGSHWGSRDWLRGTGDLTGDRRPDIVTRVGSRLFLNAGTATGFSAAVLIGIGWGGMAAVTSIGDFDGDGKADLIGRTSAGRLVLYRGNGKGKLVSIRVLKGSYQGTRFTL